MYCTMCFGFWVGLGLSLLWYSPTENFFLDACIGSSVSWFSHCISIKLLQHTTTTIMKYEPQQPAPPEQQNGGGCCGKH